MEKIVIVGAGDHAECVLANILEEKSFDVVGFLDREKKGKVLGYPILGADDVLPKLKAMGIRFAFPGAVIGAKADTGVCRRIMESIVAHGLDIPNLISSKATVRLNVSLGRGVLVQPGAIIDVGARLGNGVVVNPTVLVGHHCVVDDYVVFAGGAVLNARLHIGQGAFIGMGANVFADVGANSKVAPGTTVLEPVPGGHMAFGNPMRMMKRI